jgi:hypothetical protein
MYTWGTWQLAISGTDGNPDLGNSVARVCKNSFILFYRIYFIILFIFALSYYF